MNKTLKKIAVALAMAAAVIGSWLFGRPDKPEPLGAGPTYYAEYAADGTILRVIVADQSFIDSGAVGDPKQWAKTDAPGSDRYPAIGDKYDPKNDEYIKPSYTPKPEETLDIIPEPSIEVVATKSDEIQPK